ncbi:conserved protein of unknown function [Cupriavidus neocaledonicus]|uniref:Uncharacterized protein n=1 Tax=Cupriavidus neocaledonicus TaxID=1040979 RepID=A0A375HB71_9BURK|nr:conserved protein of unknown function [Cupriavidus neocaledonicus]
METRLTTDRSRPVSISDQDVVDFMEARQVSSNCPCCGRTVWHRLKEPFYGVNYKISPTIPDGYGGSQSNYFDVIVMYCMNCGFLRQHASHMIKAWKVENGRQ